MMLKNKCLQQVHIGGKLQSDECLQITIARYLLATVFKCSFGARSAWDPKLEVGVLFIDYD
jgi:hypothetical protein